MSFRNVRLCDYRYAAETQCSSPFNAECALCSRDLCTSHLGQAGMGVEVIIRNNNDKQVLTNEDWSLAADRDVRVCEDCRGVLKKVSGRRFAELLGSIKSAVVETAKAALAEIKLSESAK